MVKVKEDLTGQTFDRLTVIEQADDHISPNGKHRPRWRCKCNCEKGNEIVVCGDSLKGGKVHSCGCLRKENHYKKMKKYNDYEVQEYYVIMYTSKGEPFFVDLEDFWKVKDICWSKNEDNYIVSGVYGQKQICLNRYIMDCPDDKIVDHKNGEESKNNNCKYNLRICTYQENMMNRKINVNNKSGVTGVFYLKRENKWVAQIKYNKKNIRLGYFKNFDDAVDARKKAEDKYFGEFSRRKSREGELYET